MYVYLYVRECGTCMSRGSEPVSQSTGMEHVSGE